jgi:hypothetical protein
MRDNGVGDGDIGNWEQHACKRCNKPLPMRKWNGGAAAKKLVRDERRAQAELAKDAKQFERDLSSLIASLQDRCVGTYTSGCSVTLLTI